MSGGEYNVSGHVLNVSGSRNRAEVQGDISNTAISDLQGQIRLELARFQRLLQEGSPADKSKAALIAVNQMQIDLDDPEKSGLDNPRTLRQRLRKLVDALTPAATLISGLSAIIVSLENIYKHI